jgi:hypothetical protein
LDVLTALPTKVLRDPPRYVPRPLPTHVPRALPTHVPRALPPHVPRALPKYALALLVQVSEIIQSEYEIDITNLVPLYYCCTLILNEVGLLPMLFPFHNKLVEVRVLTKSLCNLHVIIVRLLEQTYLRS